MGKTNQYLTTENNHKVQTVYMIIEIYNTPVSLRRLC